MGYCRINKASKQTNKHQQQQKTTACPYLHRKKTQKIRKNTYSVFILIF